MQPVGREAAEESNEIAVARTTATQDRLDADNASFAALQPSNGAGYNETQESMAEPELLALIIELRLRDGRTSGRDKSNGSKSSTSAVDTLDLCHRKIEKLPYDMVNIIKDDVVR